MAHPNTRLWVMEQDRKSVRVITRGSVGASIGRQTEGMWLYKKTKRSRQKLGEYVSINWAK